MSRRRDKIRARRRRLWDDTKRDLLREARAALGLQADELIPDAVLLAEVDGYVPPGPPKHGTLDYGVGRRKKWFVARLSGLANTDAERRALGSRFKQGPAGGLRWGLLGFADPARRSPQGADGRRPTRRSA